MSPEEMSDLFDLMSNANQINNGLDKTDILYFNEYEKSVYLTIAQIIFVTYCYNGKNDSGYQFEVTEEDRRTLDSLIRTVYPQVYDNQGRELINIVDESVFYQLPSNLMAITYESVKFNGDDECIDGISAIVQPVTQDEFWKTYKNPFRGPNQKRVLRLDAAGDVVELVSKYPIEEYLVRYIKKPNPIILVEMPTDYDVTLFGGNTTMQGCELDDNVHAKIVEIAVNIALQRKSIGNK